MTETNSSEIVCAFLGEWPNGAAALRQSFRDYLADDVDYENVGLTHSRSLDEALALIDNFMPGLDRIDVDMLAIAQDGDKAHRSITALVKIVAEHVGPFRVAEMGAAMSIAARNRGLSG
jgi:limonene-1,2-epoxide hydrolase